MLIARSDIAADMLGILSQLADDWEYGGPLTETTLFRTEMGLESLDVVVLAASVQEQYGVVIPFHVLFAEIGQRDDRDVTIGEWIDFIAAHFDAEIVVRPREELAA